MRPWLSLRCPTVRQLPASLARIPSRPPLQRRGLHAHSQRHSLKLRAGCRLKPGLSRRSFQILTGTPGHLSVFVMRLTPPTAAARRYATASDLTAMHGPLRRPLLVIGREIAERAGWGPVMSVWNFFQTLVCARSPDRRRERRRRCGGARYAAEYPRPGLFVSRGSTESRAPGDSRSARTGPVRSPQSGIAILVAILIGILAGTGSEGRGAMATRIARGRRRLESPDTNPESTHGQLAESASHRGRGNAAGGTAA